MITTTDARALIALWKTSRGAVRDRANTLLCEFIDQYDDPTAVILWLLDVLAGCT